MRRPTSSTSRRLSVLRWTPPVVLRCSGKSKGQRETTILLGLSLLLSTHKDWVILRDRAYGTIHVSVRVHSIDPSILPSRDALTRFSFVRIGSD
jgi:hypothetical protein